MKRCLLAISLIFCVVSVCLGQAVQFFHDGENKPDIYANRAIKNLEIKISDDGKIKYVLDTRDGIKEYDTSDVDSIVFNKPHIVVANHRILVPNDCYVFQIHLSFEGIDDTFAIIDPTGRDITDEVEYLNHRDFRLYVNGETKYGTYKLKYGPYSDEFEIVNTEKPLFDLARPEYFNFGPEAADFELSSSMRDFEIRCLNESWFEREYNWIHINDLGEGRFHVKIDPYDRSDSIMRNVELDFYNADGIDVPIGIKQVWPFIHTSKEHMDAIWDFYETANVAASGANWSKDLPLNKWDFRINQGWNINDHIVNFVTGGGQYSGIHGTLPASFGVLMDDIHGRGELDLANNALYGIIPENIKRNKYWPEYGWNFIQQNTCFGGGFDNDQDFNLYIDDVEAYDFVKDETSTTMEILGKNKLTWVMNCGAVDMIDGINDDRINKYLDYRDKGLGLVAEVGKFWDETYDNYLAYVNEQQENNGQPKEISWIYGRFDKACAGPYGSMSILDDEGKLIWHINYVYEWEGFEERIINEVDAVCRKYLGEPTAHEEYVSSYYESTDYSRDGEVVELQKATKGRGIDLVFLGDQYVDRDLEPGGVFETEMENAMEQFFSVEPYTSMRDRFNVYAIKTVSKNNYRGPEHAIDLDGEKAFEYINRIPGVDMDNVTATVIKYNPNFAMVVSGYTNMYDNGASIAWINEGGASPIVVHEAGGHGFAKLLDEYVYGEASDNKISDEQIDGYRTWFETTYTSRGWGANLSVYDDPELVGWKHFIKDERYDEGLGVYQGAWLFPFDMWRPTEKSIMSLSESYFNAPSREAIYKRIMHLSEGESWTYDYEEFVAFDKAIAKSIKATKRDKSFDFNRAIEHHEPKLKKIVNGVTTDIANPFVEKEETHPLINNRIVEKKSQSGSVEADDSRSDFAPKHDRVICRKGATVRF